MPAHRQRCSSKLRRHGAWSTRPIIAANTPSRSQSNDARCPPMTFAFTAITWPWCSRYGQLLKGDQWWYGMFVGSSHQFSRPSGGAANMVPKGWLLSTSRGPETVWAMRAVVEKTGRPYLTESAVAHGAATMTNAPTVTSAPLRASRRASGRQNHHTAQTAPVITKKMGSATAFARYAAPKRSPTPICVGRRSSHSGVSRRLAASAISPPTSRSGETPSTE